MVIRNTYQMNKGCEVRFKKHANNENYRKKTVYKKMREMSLILKYFFFFLTLFHFHDMNYNYN